MLLNGIQCGGFVTPGKDVVEFSLSGTTIEACGALDGQDLVLTDDDGESTLASFAGYEVTGVWQSNGAVRLRAARELEADSKAAIRAIEANLTALTGKVETVEDTAESASSAGTDTMQAVGELGAMMDTLQQSNADIMQAIGELGTLIGTISAGGADKGTDK